MRLIPILAGARVHDQGHVDLGRGFHVLVNLFGEVTQRFLVDLKNQFVVHPHDHVDVVALAARLVNGDHGLLVMMSAAVPCMGALMAVRSAEFCGCRFLN